MTVMATMGKEDPEPDLAAVNRKILEIKKMIQLSEGQRKARYEECDTEKKRNTERIKTLKKQLKDLHAHLGKPPKCNEAALKTSNKDPKELIALRNKRSEEAVQLLQLRVIDLRKKLDLIKHQTKLGQQRMRDLADEYQQLTRSSATAPLMKKMLEPDDKMISNLENQIHLVELNQMETEHMRKKYHSIRANLLEDSAMFESTLDKLEKEIMKQEQEISQMQSINKEAVGLRNSTKGHLVRQEVTTLNVGKSRLRQMQELRVRVEERKQELERLERRIFPPVRPLVHQDSTTSGDNAEGTVDDNTKETENLEAAFNTLKQATGVTECEEVLVRFLSQRESKSRLSYLKATIEEEKRKLEKSKDMMEAKLEAFRFAQVKDKEQNEEELEKLKLAIENKVKQTEAANEDVANIRAQLIKIKQFLHALCCSTKVGGETVPQLTPGEENAQEMLHLLERNLLWALQYLDQTDQLTLILPHDVEGRGERDEGTIFGGELGVPEKGSEEDDDDEDVPSRGFLKRQAQVILDAKSRRKGYRVSTAQRTMGKIK